MAQAQLPYALGQHLMGYANQEDPYKNLAAQANYSYAPRFNNPYA
jgi:hypothetical protein